MQVLVTKIHPNFFTLIPASTDPDKSKFLMNCDLVTDPRAFSSIFIYQTCLNSSSMVGRACRYLVFIPLPKRSYKNTPELLHPSGIGRSGHVQVLEFFDEIATYCSRGSASFFGHLHTSKSLEWFLCRGPRVSLYCFHPTPEEVVQKYV